MSTDKKHKEENEEQDKPVSENIIPAGTVQETGFTRFIRKSDEDPEIIRDAKLNNLDGQDENDKPVDDSQP